MDASLDDVRATTPVQRLLEDSWEARSDQISRRELLTESVAAVGFLAVAVPLAVLAITHGGIDWWRAAVLVVAYAVVSRAVRFPVGAGYVLVSYLALAPMLLLLPPRLVPLLVGGALALGTLGRMAAGANTSEKLPSSVADGWHSLGPALVLSAAGDVQGLDRALIVLAAFGAACAVDLLTATVREALVNQIAPQLQARVLIQTWLIDACVAPIGIAIGVAADHHLASLTLLIPVCGLMVFAERDRNARIEQANQRLEVVAHERTRLQAAVHRLGDALAAKLELSALAEVLVHGSVEAVDATAGRLILTTPVGPEIAITVGGGPLSALLEQAGTDARREHRPRQVQSPNGWSLALPMRAGTEGGGVLAVARVDRAFTDDERELIARLVNRAELAATEIIAHEALHEQARTDPLTQLGNRRRLAENLTVQLATVSPARPLLLMVFDLNGFKPYNDTFGHPAGDALLVRLGYQLRAAVAPYGSAYRLGGDEFCVLLPAGGAFAQTAEHAARALQVEGEGFAISASSGSVLLPHEATTADHALRLADERMYDHKHGRRAGDGLQAYELLTQIMRARQRGQSGPGADVPELARRVAARLGLDVEAIQTLGRAAELRELTTLVAPVVAGRRSRPGSPSRADSVTAERVLATSPALRPVAAVIRSLDERWDGGGAPDHLCGDEIPIAARIIAACNAYQAGLRDRPTPGDLAAGRRRLAEAAGSALDPTVVEALLAELSDPAVVAGAGRSVDAAGLPDAPDIEAGSMTDDIGRIRRLLEATSSSRTD